MSLAATDSLLGLGKTGDLRQWLLFLLGALLVFRIGSFILVPGIDPEQLAELFRSQRGVGNGISLIIFAGIAAGLPQAVGGTLKLVRTGAFSRTPAATGLRGPREYA